MKARNREKFHDIICDIVNTVELRAFHTRDAEDASNRLALIIDNFMNSINKLELVPKRKKHGKTK